MIRRITVKNKRLTHWQKMWHCYQCRCRWRQQRVCQLNSFTLWANSAGDKLVIVFLIFLENRIWHFMQIVSFLWRQFARSAKSYFLGKIRKILQNIICWKFLPACKVLICLSWVMRWAWGPKDRISGKWIFWAYVKYAGGYLMCNARKVSLCLIWTAV